jgi:hypothetical protein
MLEYSYGLEDYGTNSYNLKDTYVSTTQYCAKVNTLLLKNYAITLKTTDYSFWKGIKIRMTTSIPHSRYEPISLEDKLVEQKQRNSFPTNEGSEAFQDQWIAEAFLLLFQSRPEDNKKMAN